jgi:hypothetical protein
MANANGYIITAMDWRGMSSFDLLMVVKILMSKPRVFQSVRDNLIQGYVNKLALQHFSRHGLLKSEWLQFKTGSNQNHAVPLYQGLQPAFVFYGISQGGILGAGYSALSGPTRLIDRAILGVPGTPFALIMTRSLDFLGYDLILLLNFYNNRHVRILLSLVQMAWDSVEGSGVLAPPLTEPYPTILMQAGLGDSVVPTIACEALARALGASTLPNSPREIYGVPVVASTKVTLDANNTPPAVLTELKYVEEYANLPVDDTKEPDNDVHICVRQDPHLIQQVAEFINTGRIMDPCAEDGCMRARVHCGVAQ